MKSVILAGGLGTRFSEETYLKAQADDCSLPESERRCWGLRETDQNSEGIWDEVGQPDLPSLVPEKDFEICTSVYNLTGDLRRL